MRSICANFAGWLTHLKNCNLAVFAPLGVLVERALERTAQLLLKKASLSMIYVAPPLSGVLVYLHSSQVCHL